jgi:hypothetical protein
MQVRLPFAILALSAAFAGGVATSQVIEREARAQSGAQSASMYVPVEGLAFRGADGRVIARLSYDARGGAFEVFDNHERAAIAMRPGLVAEAPRPSATPLATAAAPFGIPVAPASSPIVDLGY